MNKSAEHSRQTYKDFSKKKDEKGGAWSLQLTTNKYDDHYQLTSEGLKAASMEMVKFGRRRIKVLSTVD